MVRRICDNLTDITKMGRPSPHIDDGKRSSSQYLWKAKNPKSAMMGVVVLFATSSDEAEVVPKLSWVKTRSSSLSRCPHQRDDSIRRLLEEHSTWSRPEQLSSPHCSRTTDKSKYIGSIYSYGKHGRHHTNTLFIGTKGRSTHIYGSVDHDFDGF